LSYQSETGRLTPYNQMTNSYDNQTLFAYLLGALPDSESERLDEMTFIDGEFAEAVKIAEKDLVDSYVGGELSDQMREQFESHYMASPLRREKVAFARALDNFAYQAGKASDPTPAPLREVPSRAGSGWFKTLLESLGFLGGGNRGFAFAAGAAMVLLLLVSGWLIFRGLIEKRGGDIATGTNKIENPPVPTATPFSTASTVPITVPTPNTKPTVTPIPEVTPTPKRTVEPSQPMIAAITLVPSLRGGQKLAQLGLKTGTTRADFAIGLESSEYPAYKVELIDQDSGKRVWQAMSVKSHGKGSASSLNVKIPANLLRSNVYSFAVSGVAKDGSSENVGDYPFKVVR